MKKYIVGFGLVIGALFLFRSVSEPHFDKNLQVSSSANTQSPPKKLKKQVPKDKEVENRANPRSQNKDVFRSDHQHDESYNKDHDSFKWPSPLNTPLKYLNKQNVKTTLHFDPFENPSPPGCFIGVGRLAERDIHIFLLIFMDEEFDGSSDFVKTGWSLADSSVLLIVDGDRSTRGGPADKNFMRKLKGDLGFLFTAGKWALHLAPFKTESEDGYRGYLLQRTRDSKNEFRFLSTITLVRSGIKEREECRSVL